MISRPSLAYGTHIRYSTGWRFDRITAPPKERNTHPTPGDYCIKSICPSGGHGRGYRLALQNRAAARHVPLTVNFAIDETSSFNLSPAKNQIEKAKKAIRKRVSLLAMKCGPRNAQVVQ